jgi:hypothetical protein
MKAKVVQDADVVTYVVVCDPGDEAVTALAQFVRAERLEAAQVTAIGAFERAIVGWFDRAAKQYRRIPVDEQSEVLSLIGDVAEGQDGPHPGRACCPGAVGRDDARRPPPRGTGVPHAGGRGD